MPVDWSQYPSNWKEIAMRIKEDAGWICQECGKQCRKPGEPFDTHRRTLTVSHQDHDTKNNTDDNLKALCAPCHLRYDRHHHARNRRKASKGRKQ